MTGSGAGSPKIRLDLVEFELRHLKVRMGWSRDDAQFVNRSMWRSSSSTFWR
jgi:hypothetical protein